MIVFRTETSTKTGFRHLSQSTYLASLLKHKTDILFCIGTGSDKIINRYLQEKKWSYCSLKQLQQIPANTIKSIVFDLSNFSDEDVRLMQRARTNHWITVQFTDLGLNQQEVDFTIDSSLEKMIPYDREKILLSGPEFAILHNKFRHFHKVERKYRKKIKKVFISLGGAVEYRNLREMIDLLSRQRWEIKVAPGFYLKKSFQKSLRRIYPGIHFVGKTESLARPFFEADVAVINPGLAAYEAAAVGTPALYFSFHSQQKWFAGILEKKGLGLEISNIEDLNHVKIAEKMNFLTLEKRIAMGQKGKELVDARGVYRIIDLFKQRKIF